MNCKLQFSDIEQWNNILNVVGLLRKTIKSIPKFISPCTRRHDCQRGEAPFFWHSGIFLYHATRGNEAESSLHFFQDGFSNNNACYITVDEY